MQRLQSSYNAATAIEPCSVTGLILTYFLYVYHLSFALCLYQFSFTVLTYRLIPSFLYFYFYVLLSRLLIFITLSTF
jgi:hypothetical protein